MSLKLKDHQAANTYTAIVDGDMTCNKKDKKALQGNGQEWSMDGCHDKPQSTTLVGSINSSSAIRYMKAV